jgi:hypothetical protein
MEKIFEAIKTFVHELANIHDKKFYSLVLYNRLLSQTLVNHTKAIEKHKEAFRAYCIKNGDSILEKNLTNLTNDKIIYSDKVFLNIKEIFDNSDDNTKNVIWNHLIYIYALIEPDAKEKAKDILKVVETKNNNDDLKCDDPFVQSVIDKVTSNVDLSKTSNPMEAVNSLMSSGVLNDIMQSMNTKLESGELNVNSLLQTVTKMSGGSLDPNMLNMISSMTNMQNLKK